MCFNHFLLLLKRTIFNRLLNDKNSEKFCKTFHDRIEIAQKEIKNLNSFMSSDISDGNYPNIFFIRIFD